MIKILFQSETNQHEMQFPINHELVSVKLHELTGNNSGKVALGKDRQDHLGFFRWSIGEEEKKR